MIDLLQGDCLALMRAMPANSVDLIATDPPFFKVKGEAWDNQWATPAAFLAWFDLLAEQWQRILRPNGSLYAFAWPKMAARVEVLLDERFNVLNSIAWRKEHGRHKAARKEDLRSYFPASERVIFAEHAALDSRGRDGELRGAIFEPIRSWFRQRLDAARITGKDVNRAIGSSTSGGGMAGHYTSVNQFEIPTAQSYALLQAAFPVFDRHYDDLRSEYESLRLLFEQERRAFFVDADVAHTDVWDFPVVLARSKHPCEKPLAMMEHIIRASSRPGAVVLDCFMGSGVTGEAAIRLGRDFIGMEMDPEYFASASARLGRPVVPAPLVLDLPRAAPAVSSPRHTPPPQLALFG